MVRITVQIVQMEIVVNILIHNNHVLKFQQQNIKD